MELSMFNQKVFWLCLAFMMPCQMIASQTFDSNALVYELKENNFFSKTPGTVTTFCTPLECRTFSTGVANIKTQKKLNENHRHRVGSLTKFMVAVLIMQLIEENQITLDDKLEILLPEYKNWSEVKVRHLLQMQSGIPDYLFNRKVGLEQIFMLSTGTRKQVKPKDILKTFKNKKLVYQPGTNGSYNNTNYVLLGLIVEKYRDMSLSEALHKFIFQALNLEKTYLDLGVNDQNHFANGYVSTQSLGFPESFTFLAHPKHRVKAGILDVTYALPVQNVWAAGAAVSVPEEMSRLVMGVLTGKILQHETIEEMKQTKFIEILGIKIPYGLGLMKIKTPYGDAYGHGGVGFGYQNSTYYIPEHNLSFTHVQNTGPGNDYGDINSILRAYLEGTNDQTFYPKSDLISENYNEGLHLRAKGMISNDFNLRVTGYGKYKKNFQKKLSYNRFFIETKMINERKFILIKGLDFSIFSKLSTKKSHVHPASMSYTFIDLKFLKKLQKKHSDLLVTEDSINKGAIYSFVSKWKKSKRGQLEEECVHKMNEASKLTIAQFGTEKKTKSFQKGEIFKFLANIPMRDVNRADQLAIEKMLQLKICS